MVSNDTSTTNIGSRIISSLGSGSGINNSELINELTELERAPQAGRLSSRQKLMEAQLSDFGLLRSALGKLESAVAAVSDRDTFDAKAISLPQTSLIALTKLNANAVPGDYRLQVEQVAQSHSLSSGSFASPNAAIGKGTLNLQFGSWNDGQQNFSVNPDKAGAVITIDDSNNSLIGLRDAINEAGVGVQATIVSDGGAYKLLLTSPSGEHNELEITADEDPDALGLASFAFNESSQQLTHEQDGKDAKLRVNGLLVSRESNHITDVIEGLEFDIFNSSASEVINLNITADTSVAEQAIRDFVAAYNTFLAEVGKLTGFDEELGEDGSLRSDPLAKNLVETLRGFIGSAVPGLGDSFNMLAFLGIRTRTDGTLQIVENANEINTNFRAAIDNHFDQVRDLFVPRTSTSTNQMTVLDYGPRTQPGTYEVEITQQPAKGFYEGDLVAETFPLDTSGKDYSFVLQLDNVMTSTISLPDGKVYNSAAEIAADFQALINMDPAVRAANLGVKVSFDTESNSFVFNSDAYGNNSIVSFLSAGEDMADLGIAEGAGEAGQDVAGTINGVAGFGYGNVLLPALRSPAEGLSLVIEPGTTSATVTFSRGFAGGMTSMIDDFLKSSGLISEREETLKKDLEKVGDDMTALERRSEAFRARLQAQFIAMEMIVRSLNTTGNFLDGLNDRLPFTAPRR